VAAELRYGAEKKTSLSLGSTLVSDNNPGVHPSSRPQSGKLAAFLKQVGKIRSVR
jgi:hypothetical protein